MARDYDRTEGKHAMVINTKRLSMRGMKEDRLSLHNHCYIEAVPWCEAQ